MWWRLKGVKVTVLRMKRKSNDEEEDQKVNINSLRAPENSHRPIPRTVSESDETFTQW